ncbi:MAG: translation initiation factor IF-2 N-terminal domain-containing protein, partial [Ruminiclostridium sp.]|nr:translation initiation factor IF-2 N-terminal domain-containing protein [Ruminiclostridium sp.]
MVKELAGTERKPAGSLTESELNLVLEKVSQSNQVKDFEAYFAATEKKAAEPEKKEAPKAEKKTAPKAEVKAEPKAEPKAEEKQAPKAEPKEEPKAEPKAEKPVEKKAEAPKQEEKKPFDKNKQDRPQRNDRPAQNDRFEKRQNGDRPQQGGKFDKNGDKPKFDKNNNNKFGDRDRRNDRNDRPQQDKKPVQQPVKQEIKIDINAVKTNETPKAKVKGEAVKRGEQVTKYVDTRGSYVDLDKYNERYETIAPQGRNGRSHDEGFTKKQKINQKSQNKKPFGSKNNRETEAQKLKRLELERARKQQLKVLIPDEIVVSELAQRLKVTASEVIKKLMLLGEMCTINQTIDFDTASLVAEE